MMLASQVPYLPFFSTSFVRFIGTEPNEALRVLYMVNSPKNLWLLLYPEANVACRIICRVELGNLLWAATFL
jgi:hypothetical protein